MAQRRPLVSASTFIPATSPSTLPIANSASDANMRGMEIVDRNVAHIDLDVG
jgi:hypothetical protein